MIENVALAVATTDNCRYCLMCRHVCPVGHVTRLETLTPHGWGLLIASQRRGLITWNASSVDKLYSCADCGTCRAHCVTDQPLPDAIAAARAEVAALGLAPAARLPAQRGAAAHGAIPTSQAEPQPVQRARARSRSSSATRRRYLWPDGAGGGARRCCKPSGVDPVLIGAGRNNGYLASSLGFPDTARSLAQATLDDLRASRRQHAAGADPGRLLRLPPALRRAAGPELGRQDVELQGGDGLCWPSGWRPASCSLPPAAERCTALRLRRPGAHGARRRAAATAPRQLAGCGHAGAGRRAVLAAGAHPSGRQHVAASSPTRRWPST